MQHLFIWEQNKSYMIRKRTKRDLMQFANNTGPGQGLRCPLTESMETVVISTNRDCPVQTARMHTLIRTFSVYHNRVCSPGGKNA